MKITIFGLAGTGTSTVGKKLAGELSYTYLSSGDMMRAEAKDRGLTLEQYHEHCKSDPSYDRALDERMKEFGETHDNFVVESRLAWHFIPNSLKIKLYTDFDVRAERLARREGVSTEHAKRHILAREETDNVRYKAFYGIADINADTNYDMVIDTSALSPEHIVEKIAAFAQR